MRTMQYSAASKIQNQSFHLQYGGLYSTMQAPIADAAILATGTTLLHRTYSTLTRPDYRRRPEELSGGDVLEH